MPPASTSGPDYAAPLVGVTALVSGFAAITHSQALIGKIPGMQLVPFRTKIPVEDQGANFAWTAEGFSKSFTGFRFSNGVVLNPLKAGGIVIFRMNS